MDQLQVFMVFEIIKKQKHTNKLSDALFPLVLILLRACKEYETISEWMRRKAFSPSCK